MSTKTLTGLYSAGYTLSPSYDTLIATAKAEIEGAGVLAPAFATFVNKGEVLAAPGADGVDLAAGGKVVNYGHDYAGAGGDGVLLGASGTIVNHSAIRGGSGSVSGGSGVVLLATGTVSNLSGSIFGGTGGDGAPGGEGAILYAAGLLANSGTIVGGQGGAGAQNQASNGASGGFGVELVSGATLTNTGAIGGGSGGDAGSYRRYFYYYGYRRFVTIFGMGGAGGAGLIAETGSHLTNAGDISGGQGIYGADGGAGGAGVIDGAATFTNSGTITGGGGGDAAPSWVPFTPIAYGGPGGDGVDVGAGGVLINTGVIVPGAGGSNPARGARGYGVVLSAGGSIVNGDVAHRAASITKIETIGPEAATVNNYGTITDIYLMSYHGRLIAEAGSKLYGTIWGGFGGGVLEFGAGVGTIKGSVGVKNGFGTNAVYGGLSFGFSGFGSYLLDAGDTWELSNATLVNQTLANSGTIVGMLTLTAGDLLIAGEGSVFSNPVAGGGGTLGVDGGVGTITGLGGSGTLSGADAMAFSGFSAYVIDAGGSWSLAGGAGTIGFAQTLTNAGTINGALSLRASSDRLIVKPGAVFVGEVAGGGGTLELAAGAIGAITGFGGSGTINAGASMSFSGFGAYVVDTLSSPTLAGANTLGAGQTLTNLGSISVTGALNVGGSLINQGVIAGVVGSGVVPTAGIILNDTAGLITGVIGVYGNTGAATVDNFGTIEGTGGVAVEFNSAGDHLIAEAGSRFLGTVKGGGGTLELGGGAIDVTGIGSAGTVTGAENLTFSGFGQYVLDAGSAQTITGDNTLAAGAKLILNGDATNLGTITSVSGDGVTIRDRLTNGNKAASAALIQGVIGVYADPLRATTVTNYGVIVGTGGVAIKFGSSSDRLILESSSQISGVVQGGGGTLELAATVGAVAGLGTGFTGFGAYVLDAGGQWSASGTNTLANGASFAVLGTLTNLGTIAAVGADGVVLNGSVINGSSASNAELIKGVVGVYAGPTAHAASVTNFGTIQGTGGEAVEFKSAGNTLVLEGGSRLIGEASGDHGTLELAVGTGTVSGLGSSFTAFGVYTIDGGANWSVTGSNTIAGGGEMTVNGSLSIATGLTLQGTGTAAVLTTSGAGVVRVNDGAHLAAQGLVANAGTIALQSVSKATDLEILASGVTLTGGGAVTLGGPKARILGSANSATFVNVDDTLAGTGAIGQGYLIVDNEAAGVIDANAPGQLIFDPQTSTVTNSGILEASGAGTLVISHSKINQAGGGQILAQSGALVDVEDVAIKGGTVGSAAGGTLKFNLAGSELNGGASAVTVTGTARVVAASNLLFHGNIVNTGKLFLAAGAKTADLIVGTGGVTLTGAGQINLTNSAGNRIYGLASNDKLTNFDNRIDGAGLLGDGVMTLINDAGGAIIGNQNLALTIDTGTATIINAGLIENVGKGGTLVMSAVNNTGTLKAATAGTLTMAGAVTGAGVGQINGGTLYVEQAFAENVAFTGTSGALKLGDSQGFTGAVTGLSKTGASWLDLGDIAFLGKTKATYADNGSHSGGVLTVTDGTHTAHITLVGNYAGSAFSVTTDGQGGIKVTAAPANSRTFAGAMATFGSELGSATSAAYEPRIVDHPMLTLPARWAIA